MCFVRENFLPNKNFFDYTRSTIYDSAVGSAVENCFIAPCCIYFSSASKCQFYNLICQTFFNFLVGISQMCVWY